MKSKETPLHYISLYKKLMSDVDKETIKTNVLNKLFNKDWLIYNRKINNRKINKKK